MKLSTVIFAGYCLPLAVIAHVFINKILERRSLHDGDDEESCPTDYDSSICICTVVGSFQCRNADNDTQIETTLRRSRIDSNSVNEFRLVSSKISKFRDGFFDKFLLKEIVFIENNLGTISKFAFNGSEESVERLVMGQNNFSTEFDLEFIRPFRNLKMVSFYGNNFVTISKRAFGNLQNLRDVYIIDNKFITLEKFALTLLPKLDYVALSSNNLIKLEKNMLNTSQAQNPFALDLDNNNIREVKAGAFADLKTGRVNLENNQLTTLNQDAFEPLLDYMFSVENSELHLKGNPIVCDSSLDWLDKKPIEYRQRVKGLQCTEITTTPQNCLYKTNSDLVQAFFHGKLLVNQSPIPHLGVITLRCTNVQNLKFVGNNKIKCLSGKFTDAMPHCITLLPNNYDTAPPLWFMTYPTILPPITEDGIIVVPRGSAVSIFCWWSRSKPDMTVTGTTKFKSPKLINIDKARAWRTKFYPIYEISRINYTCGVPGSQPGGNLTQTLQIKITDSCRVDEKQIRASGLSIDPRSRHNIYVEEERVNFMCTKFMARAVQYMTCKRKGEWEWGPKEDCAKEETEAPGIEANP